MYEDICILMMWRKNLQCFWIRNIWTGDEFCTFPASDLHLAQMTLGESFGTPLGHKQSLYEIRTSNVNSLNRYWPNTNYPHFLPLTLTLPEWHWVKVLTHPQVLIKLKCEIRTSIPMFPQKKDMDRTHI